MRKSFLLLVIGAALSWAAPDHLVFTELAVSPSTGEYVKINNPTATAVDLSDYYITDATDATDTTAAKYYYNLPSGNDFWSGSGFDFIARFPDGYQLAAGAFIYLSMVDSAAFNDEYGFYPDLTVKQNLRSAGTGSTIGGASSYLSNTSETLVLFKWDSVSTEVQDVDYLIWGDLNYAIDKTGVGNYLPDTPVASQVPLPTHANGEKLARISDEGSETTTGGNGITGHDETSENLAATWEKRTVANTKPEITNVAASPANPTTEDAITISATVTDDASVTSVDLVYTADGLKTTTAMTGTGDDYALTIGPFATSQTIAYYVLAIDDTGLRDSSLTQNIFIAEPPEDFSIAEIIADVDQMMGQTVTLDAVVTVPAGLLWTGRSQAYLQDESGRGIILDKSTPIDASITRGDSVLVTAEVDLYDGTTPQLINYTVEVLKSDVALPYAELTIEELNTLEYSATFVKIWGKITARSEPNLASNNTGANVDIQDESGQQTTVRIWNSTNILYDAEANLINPALDSLLQIGNQIEVFGVADDYDGSSQLVPAFREDIREKLEGIAGDYQTSLTVAPYPFVPQLGERINYEFSFPDDARIKLRVFDLAGRYITTLYDQYRTVSYLKNDSYWNGRDEFNRYVPAGTYIMHLEVTDIKTGKLSVDSAPVVIGVYGK